MKIKWKKIVIILLIIIAIFMLWSFVIQTVKHILGWDYATLEEIEELYQENKEIFDEVAEKLSAYPDGVYIQSSVIGVIIESYVRIIEGFYADTTDDWKVYLKKGFLLTDMTENGLIEKQVEDLNTIPIFRLHRKTGISIVSKKNGRIYFEQTSNLGFSVGIAYSIDEDSDTRDISNYISEWEKIEPNWYYYKSE